ncbi:hypothetical protein ANN_11020 [Periplaneta americana]|uniref:Mos1 transposase HTH domain-containing protein n=1 Tax=Periplaneta americana TaxID=6978 RepID=A0ABQ8T544_PERAM|nr:hypothetical protein ANN_11020 [Periplaneta americana]
MSPGSSTESYPAFARIGLRENPGKNLNQVTFPDRDSNPGHLVSRPDALIVIPQVWTPCERPKTILTKLEQRFWIKIEMARGHSAQECFQGLREACGDAALPYRTVARWVKAFREDLVAPVPKGRRKTRTTGTSTVLTRYDPCDYDLFTKVKEPLRGTRYNTRDELVRALGRSIRNINKDGRADGVRRLPSIWQKDMTGKVPFVRDRAYLLVFLTEPIRDKVHCTPNPRLSDALLPPGRCHSYSTHSRVEPKTPGRIASVWTLPQLLSSLLDEPKTSGGVASSWALLIHN